MIGWLAVAVVGGTVAVCEPPGHGPLRIGTAADMQATLRELYGGGVAWPAFLDAASARRELWVRNAEAASVPADLFERARAVPGSWRILAVAIDACSDSVNTLPYVAKLAELVPSLDLRIVDSTVGREIMERHRTPDDRAATPTLLLLDGEWSEAGCFIERPARLQAWYAERQGTMPTRELTDLKMEWYAGDAGRATLADLVAMLEGAAAGSPVCAAKPAGGSARASARQLRGAGLRSAVAAHR
jgi:hypothetical protein